jgi:hypothetical protein
VFPISVSIALAGAKYIANLYLIIKGLRVPWLVLPFGSSVFCFLHVKPENTLRGPLTITILQNPPALLILLQRAPQIQIIGGDRCLLRPPSTAAPTLSAAIRRCSSDVRRCYSAGSPWRRGSPRPSHRSSPSSPSSLLLPSRSPPQARCSRASSSLPQDHFSRPSSSLPQDRCSRQPTRCLKLAAPAPPVRCSRASSSMLLRL